MLSGDLIYVNKENLKALKDHTKKVERDAQSADKIVGEQTLGPLTP